MRPGQKYDKSHPFKITDNSGVVQSEHKTKAAAEKMLKRWYKVLYNGTAKDWKIEEFKTMIGSIKHRISYG